MGLAIVAGKTRLEFAVSLSRSLSLSLSLSRGGGGGRRALYG